MDIYVPTIDFLKRKNRGIMKKFVLFFLIALQLSIPLGFHFKNACEEDQMFKKYQKQYTWYEWKGRKKIEKKLDRKTYDIIKKQCEDLNYPLHHILALAFSESRFCHTAKSKCHALGLLQIIGTIHKLDCKRLIEDPVYNVRKGIKILKWYKHLAKGNLRDTLKNYNSGPYSDFYNEPYIKEITRNIYKSEQYMKVDTVKIALLGIAINKS